MQLNWRMSVDVSGCHAIDSCRKVNERYNLASNEARCNSSGDR